MIIAAEIEPLPTMKTMTMLSEQRFHLIIAILPTRTKQKESKSTTTINRWYAQLQKNTTTTIMTTMILWSPVDVYTVGDKPVSEIGRVGLWSTALNGFPRFEGH